MLNYKETIKLKKKNGQSGFDKQKSISSLTKFKVFLVLFAEKNGFDSSKATMEKVGCHLLTNSMICTHYIVLFILFHSDSEKK